MSIFFRGNRPFRHFYLCKETLSTFRLKVCENYTDTTWCGHMLDCLFPYLNNEHCCCSIKRLLKGCTFNFTRFIRVMLEIFKLGVEENQLKTSTFSYIVISTQHLYSHLAKTFHLFIVTRKVNMTSYLSIELRSN